MPTLQTDSRSGGVRRKSGVNVLPVVREGERRRRSPLRNQARNVLTASLFAPKAWSEVRDDSNEEIDWLLIGYDGNSKTDLTLFDKGRGGIDVLSQKLSADSSAPLFGGARLRSGRLVHFLFVPDNTPAMTRGRTLLYKNGVFNVLEGCDGEVEINPGMTETNLGRVR